MKIALISPSKVHLSEMSQVLQGATSAALHGAAHELLQIEGGRSRLAEVVEAHHPDLVVVDGMGRDPDELEPVEQVTSAHPQLAVLMLCAQQSPEFLLRAMRAGVREVLGSPPTAASRGCAGSMRRACPAGWCRTSARRWPTFTSSPRPR